jgi:signal transduction histidine kinase
MEHFIKMAIAGGLLFWLATSLIGYLILKQMTGTLGVMLKGVESIAAGNLATRITLTDNSDSLRAATAINTMAETLQQREQENRRLHLEIVNSMRLEFDKEKTQYMAKLIQTNRMTSLGLLVSSMAHEINNPNGAIRLSGEYLEHAWRDMEKLLAELAKNEGDFSIAGSPFSKARNEIASTLGNLARSSTRIERVVQNLRSYSLGNRGETMDNLDVNRIAGNALAIVQAHSQKSDISIVTQFAHSLPRIAGNPFQLEQVFTNLLMNAIQALPPKGSRRVELSTGFNTLDGTVIVEIRDEGHGIEPEYIPHLCEPFFSTRINSGGSGLGLYISNFIVSEHNGRMEFDSKPGGGCTVTVYLPVAKPAS